jgi:hypothetical protein
MKTLIFALLTLLASSSRASAQTHNFTITWGPPIVLADKSDAPTGIKIEQKTGAALYAQVQSLGVTVTTATVNVPNPAPGGFTYCYRARWFNTVGNGPYSPEACGVTAVVIVPVVPGPVTGFTLSAVSSSVIRMSWNSDPDNPTEIWGKPARGGSQYASLVGITPDTATWDWTARKRYSTYCAKIRPVGGLFTEPACATTAK